MDPRQVVAVITDDDGNVLGVVGMTADEVIHDEVLVLAALDAAEAAGAELPASVYIDLCE